MTNAATRIVRNTTFVQVSRITDEAAAKRSAHEIITEAHNLARGEYVVVALPNGASITFEQLYDYDDNPQTIYRLNVYDEDGVNVDLSYPKSPVRAAKELTGWVVAAGEDCEAYDA